MAEEQKQLDEEEKHSLAQKYEQMMIEDERRDNADGDGNFKVIAD